MLNGELVSMTYSGPALAVFVESEVQVTGGVSEMVY